MTLIEQAPERGEILKVVQSWDTAIKDGPTCDFSVCTTWGWRERWYLLDVHRARLDFPALKTAALAQKNRWRADLVMVEDSSNGTALVQQLRSDQHYEFWPKKVRGSKLERFIAQTDILQSDRVAFPTKAPWFEELKRELLVFPNGRHDDQVDSITRFLEWVQRKGQGFVVEVEPLSVRRSGHRRRNGGSFLHRR